jgi:hypothetical protein
MNCLAHGWKYLHNPYFMAGTAIPDWLSIIDRKVRARAKAALLLTDHAETNVANVARGIVQHHTDDDWFHTCRAFNELNLQFAVQLREILGQEESFRPGFLGHILVELLLDAHLSQQHSDLLDEYYAALKHVNGIVLQATVNNISKQPTSLLPNFLTRYLEEQFLYDYVDDAKLLFRLNQIMRRVTLPQLPAEICSLFPQFREQVAARASELLEPGL